MRPYAPSRAGRWTLPGYGRQEQREAFLAATEIVTAIEYFIGNQAGAAADAAQTEAERDQDARAMCSRHATFYQSRIMPYFVHGGCSMPTFARMRQRIIPKARGLVAEIGFGSGLNLPYYDPAKVSRLIGIEPDPSMLGIARKRLAEFRMRIELIEGRAEALPLPDGSVDTAVVTYALCTIPDPGRALCEIRRILKPDGRLLFIEHERSTEPWRSRWQDRLNGLWGRLAGGCHLNRAPQRLIEEAGFVIGASGAGALPAAPVAARHSIRRRGAAGVTADGSLGSFSTKFSGVCLSAPSALAPRADIPPAPVL